MVAERRRQTRSSARAGYRVSESACIWSWSRASRPCLLNSCRISSTRAVNCAKTSRNLGLISARGHRCGRKFRAEIEAQFRAYQQTGLALDHVNGHKHFHLHPAVASEVIAIGRRYGMRALRIPREPAAVLAQIEPGTRGPGERWLALAWLSLRAPACRVTLAGTGVRACVVRRHVDSRVAGCFGIWPRRDGDLSASGHARRIFGSAPGYRYADELAALIDPDVFALARRSNVTLAGYGDC